MTISVELARQILDMGARLRRPEDGTADPPQAVEQLCGAVAIHNILQREGVAYLADEVGMGKTYVALGTIALFRHFNPQFRVAVIAPRENIQQKWMKEWGNFTEHIARIPDMRVKSLHGGPARPLVRCDNLPQLIRETTVNPNRDFFLRLSSFSLGTGNEEENLQCLRRRFQRELPWLERITGWKGKRQFKDGVAKAVCCALPVFDLLVVDEAHNLKHGFADRIAARNRVLAFMFGRPSADVDRREFRDYGPRAKRVLFLSATPIEDDYRQLWNQLDVFGKGESYVTLRDPQASEEQKRAVARRFLIRRVTCLDSGGERLTKNLYRREWRRGGVNNHDDPIRVDDVRQRLVVALVQKKVSELLNSNTFGASFQMGMLASFESFLETAKLRKADEESSNFDGVAQTEDDLEREGIDVRSINQLAADYRRRFNGRELPHPKMDSLVAHLSSSWKTGRKALVFLRRVASVWEVKERLDLVYNEWLVGHLRERFKDSAQLTQDLDRLYEDYRLEREATRAKRLAARMGATSDGDGDQDRGGDDTFFAWFFRGEGPRGPWLSGARFSQRFSDAGGELSTFFEDNYAADLLGVEPGGVIAAVAGATTLDEAGVQRELIARSGWYLTRTRKSGRREFFEAAQAGAMDLLREGASSGELRSRADAVWQLRFAFRRQPRTNPSDSIVAALESGTFFTALRRPDRSALRASIWPEARVAAFEHRFVAQELRRELLASMARLGHPLIEIYVLAMLDRGTLRTRTGEGSRSVEPSGTALIERLLDMLELQRRQPPDDRIWGGFDELTAAAANFDLILDVNEPAIRTKPLNEAGRAFGALLRQQQPVGGMTGQVNKTLVRQFRMPGYPLVLLSTDLLQEGEDLHTFCSDVYHYGLAWTPSAVEQRIGRVDRVRSKTERTATKVIGSLADPERLQVYYPHLEDTVERLQVRRVLRRMHEFMRLMHEGLSGALPESSKLNVAQEMVDTAELPEPVRTLLTTAFPVQESDLVGRRRSLAVTSAFEQELAARMAALRTSSDAGGLPVAWEPSIEAHALAGTVTLPSGRVQHFVLHLDTLDERLVLRCVSPVGRFSSDSELEEVRRWSIRVPEQLGVIEEADDRGVDLTVEEEVLLGDPTVDSARAAWLIARITKSADRLEEALCEGQDAAIHHVRSQLQRETRMVTNAE